MLIKRKEGSREKLYAYIGTGNFNEKTARIYTDLGLLTADKKIAREVQQVFLVLERKIIIPKVKKLLVSPFNTRSRFTELIEREIRNAESGEDAYIILKMNSLQDPQVIELLYKASKAGVKVRVLVRGICCLVPGIKGQSENIYVTSIVDRFLEHSRIYIFSNRGKETMFIGSADWMTRNLDHRIEVLAPIFDPDVFSKIRKILQMQLDDNVKARINTGGDMFWNFDLSQYYIPAETSKTSVFSSSLWIGGLDVNNQLKLAALRYRQVGQDYWTGPLTIDGTAAIDEETCAEWDKMFQINRAEVDQFIQWFNRVNKNACIAYQQHLLCLLAKAFSIVK